MHILRLSHSTETGPQAAEGDRGYLTTAKLLERALGQSVEITVRPAWPSPSLPEVVEKLLERHKPDLVQFALSTFPFNYPSVPLRLSRRFGRAGEPFARVGLKVGGSPKWGRSRPSRLGRFVFKRIIGGAFHFEPDEVAAAINGSVLRCVRRESMPVIVDGPFAMMTNREWLDPTLAEARRMALHLALQKACAAAHVYFLGWDEPLPLDLLHHFQHADRFHLGRAYQVLFGLLDARLIAMALDEQAGRAPRSVSLSAALAEADPATLGITAEQAEAIRTVARRIRFHSPLSGAHPVA